MKIALIGYGKMGQEVARQVKETKHEVISISLHHKGEKLDKTGVKKADVVIEFTSPDAVVEHVKAVALLGKPIVVGTTGWYDDHFDEVKKVVLENGIGLLYGGNFSIGANVYFKIIDYASKLFEKVGGYDVYGFEIHHRGKKDSPSGTAKKLSDIIIANSSVKKTLQNQSLQRQIEDSELHFASVRGGSNPGFHEVIFDSLADEIRLVHAARGRQGFAKGAVWAAEFIKNKKGIFQFDKIFAKEVSK